MPKDKDLASQRNLFGFDDIPVNDDDLDNIRFRDIFSAWFQQAIKHSPLETRHKKLNRLKNEKIKNWKNDLKWVMLADLEEPVKPRPKQHDSTLQPNTSSARHAQQQEPMRTSTIHSKALPDQKTIDINISFGSISKLPVDRFKNFTAAVISFAKQTSKKQRIMAGSLLAAALVFVFMPQLQRQWVIATGGNPDVVTSEKIIEKPEYRTLLPSGKSTSDVGGLKRVSPPDRNPVFAYTDTYQGVKLNVSQQPIPDTFKRNVNESVANLARDYLATDKINSGSLEIYIGTSHMGPQSVIFTKSNLLILIKSDKKLDHDSWASYAQSLH